MHTFMELQEEFPFVTRATDIAAKNGVAASFIEHNNELYFVVCPDKETLKSLREHMTQFDKILKEDYRQGVDMFNCYFGIYHIGDLQPNDSFFVHQDLCDMIHRESLVKTVYQMHGYHMPKYVSMQSISNYDDFYSKAHDRTLPDRLRETYKDTLLHQVAIDHQRYAQRENEPLYTRKVPLSFFQSNSREVDKDYFRKYHITQVNEVVRPGFITFMKQILKDKDAYPDFIYYLEKKPFMSLEDISNIAKGDDNYWENMKQEDYFSISFPLHQASDYYSMVLRYNMKEYQCIPVKDLARQSREDLRLIPVNKNDIWNINSLCVANHVPYAVDFGELNPVTAGSVYQIPVYFRFEDKEMISSILTRLSKEREGYVPIDLHDQSEAEKNKPKEYHNPFFTDRNLYNAYNQQKFTAIAAGQDR